MTAAAGYNVISMRDDWKTIYDEEVHKIGEFRIQEAFGGWMDGDTERQEYTLVIHLSDTTEDAVHAAADGPIETFNQSPVPIRANPTAAEFYSAE